VNEAVDDWDLHVEAVAFAYRVNVQASTKKTPFELMLGFRHVYHNSCATTSTTETSKLDWHQSDATTAAALVERATTVSSLLQHLRKDAHTNIEAAQAVQKKRYNVKHRESSFAVDDKILRYNGRRGVGGKFKPDRQ